MKIDIKCFYDTINIIFIFILFVAINVTRRITLYLDIYSADMAL